MNALDYVIIGIIAVAALRCVFRGLIEEVMSAAAVVGGLAAGIFFYKPVGGWIDGLVGIGGFAPVVGFVASFALVFIVVKIIAKSLKTVFENLHLGFVDKLGGALFGIVEGVLLAAVILIVLRYVPLDGVKTLLDGSAAARLFLPIIAEAMPAPKA